MNVTIEKGNHQSSKNHNSDANNISSKTVPLSTFIQYTIHNPLKIKASHKLP